MRILALDAATETCSVALWLDGALQVREAQAARGHGAHVLELIDALLADAGVTLGALDALAFGRGPGAFTGVRLAASITQGLAFAAKLPVIPVSNLRAIAQQALDMQGQPARILVCHDARMGEVYWAGFDSIDGYAQAATAEAVARPEALCAAASAWLGTAAAGVALVAAGSGFTVFPALAGMLTVPLAAILPAIQPRASAIAALAAHAGMAAAVAPEQALPVYVRNEVATAPAAVAIAT